ncbi:MAG: DUF4857 domain-containing protein [Candidatus Marinimicrobia bacterium]|nr:DUF4857 domain-containing protein [Candidatus Neomarinimicrobiota bacterium]MDD5582535.1 DUF4857 domain-containing protein [Candidatus Neomarinimicrobiota bacterium]
MIVRISRYILIVVSIVVMAIYLPDLYWLFFDVKTSSPYVSYSPVDSMFIMYRHGDNGLVFYDEEGNTYTREEYEEKLPLFYYMQLIADGRMPDSLHGIPLDPNEIKTNRNNHRIRTYTHDVPQIPLYPLLESESGRVTLEFPDEFFRITDKGMEFVNSKTKKVNKEKSALFTDALKNADFQFPAKRVYTNPTTRKPFDEGCFVIDNKNEFYHIKRAKDQPVVRNTRLPEEINICYMLVSENNLKEYYGIIISEDNRLFFLTYDNYKLVELPTKGIYKVGEMTVVITTDLFFRQVTLNKNDGIDVFVTDRNYNLIDEYHESWKPREAYPQGKVARAIFPFSLSAEDDSSAYVGLYSEWHFPLAWIGNLISLLLFALFVKKEGRTWKGAIPELILVTLTGIYGLIACMVYIYVPLWRSERK